MRQYQNSSSKPISFYKAKALNIGQQKHRWVTVKDPSNFKTVVQACDCCGVVKSENSIVKACKGEPGASLIVASQQQKFHLAG